MKKIFSAILVIVLLCSVAAPVCLAAENNQYWTIITEPASSTIIVKNTTSVYNGVAYVTLYCQPNDGSVNRIQATSYIEKLVGSQWVVMPLEDGETQWTNTVNGSSMTLSAEQKITTGTGQYRVTTTFAIYYIGVGNKYETATYTFTCT